MWRAIVATLLVAAVIGAFGWLLYSAGRLIGSRGTARQYVDRGLLDPKRSELLDEAAQMLSDMLVTTPDELNDVEYLRPSTRERANRWLKDYKKGRL